MDNSQSAAHRFVSTMIDKVKKDTACRAAFRHADTPSMESRAWEYILHFCKLESQTERRVFCLIGAAIARTMPDHDGHMSVGSALRSLCSGATEADLSTELSRLRRLLACDDSYELLDVIRHVLRYIQAQGAQICYEQLLHDTIYWGEYTRIKWTKDFFKVSEAATKD